MRVRFFLFAVVLALAEPSFGQRFHTHLYDVGAGLPGPEVHDLLQDDEGRLWFATNSGVASFDGHQWQHFDDHLGPMRAEPTALRLDSAGRLWAAAGGRGLRVSRLDDGAWTETSSREDTATGRLIGFEILEGLESPIMALALEDSLWLLRDGRWREVSETEGLPSSRIHGLALWQDRLLVATAKGLVALDFAAGSGDGLTPKVDDSWQQRLSLAPLSEVRALAVYRDAANIEELWLVGSNWLGLWRSEQFQLISRDIDLAPESRGGWQALADGLGGIYMGADSDLHYFHPRSGYEVLSAEGLETGAILTLYRDFEDNIWLGGRRGVAKLVSRRLARFGRLEGLLDDGVTALLERADGTIVVGHRGGLTFLTDSTLADSTIERLPLTTNGRRVEVRDLVEATNGDLWLAAGSAGLWRLEKDSRRRTVISAAAVNGSDTDSEQIGGVEVLLLDMSGQLWVGTGDGVYVESGGQLTRVPGSPPAVQVLDLFEDRDRLLVATTAGLFGLDGNAQDGNAQTGNVQAGNVQDGNVQDGAARGGAAQYGAWHRITCVNGGRCNRVFVIANSPDDGQWVGTAAGLYRVVGHELQPETREQQPRIESSVFFVQQEKTRLWFGTQDGVLRWDPEGPRMERLSIEDGLAGRESRRGTSLVDLEGRLWIGSDRGLTVFDRRFERSSRAPPRVTLLTVSGGGESWPLDQDHRFGSGIDDLSFDFRVVSFIDEQRTELSRRLLGFEDEWSEPFLSTDQEVRYTNLPPSDYRFQLRARAPGGAWSPVVSSELVRVSQPFWRRPWFYAALLFALIAAGQSLNSYFAQRRYSRKLEREVDRRVAELKVSEDRYRKTFKGIDDGVITTDSEGKIELLNPAAQELTGWTADEAVGLLLEEVLQLFQDKRQSSGEGAELAADLGAPLPLLGGSFQDTIGPTQAAILSTRAKELRRVEVSLSPMITREAGFAGIVVACRDVTRKRELEEELARAQKLEAIGILAGGIAHDFNNLLTVLLGNVSLLQEGLELSQEDGELLSDAEGALMRARDLTQQLLTFSRGGAPVRQAGSIGEVIRESASFVLSGTKLRSEIDLPDDLRTVEIDAGQISQVLNNLLINATQAMPSGGTVRVIGRNSDQASPPLPSGRYVAIEVIDSGVGIPESLQSRIFDPYFSTKEKGRGLGLASAYSIIKNHEGLLTVKSQPGIGTTFTVFLPASGAADVSTRDAEVSSFVGRGRILLMDDDATVQRTAGTMLRRLGFEVTVADEGREAIDRYSSALEEGWHYDAVLMDLTVPGGMGGQDAVKRLLALDPKLVAVVYSGYSNDPVLANFRHFGFSGRLSKPFRMNDLRTVLEEVLEPRAQPDP